MRMLTILIALVGPQITGCQFVAAFVDSTSQKISGEISCAGTPCELDRWVIVQPGGTNLFFDLPTPGCDMGYDLAFAAGQAGVIAVSVNVARDLRVATITRNGRVHLSAFGAAQDMVQADLNALDLAWSNQGDRLAVLTRGESGPPALVLLDPDLTELDRFELSDAPFRVVTWSGDDRQIAVTARVSARSSNGDASTVCTLITPASQSVEVHEGITGYFVGVQQLVGWRDAAQRFEVFVLEDGQVSQARPLNPQPESIRDAFSAYGLIVTAEPSFAGDVLTIPVLSLRTPSAGPNPLREPFAGQPDVIPLDTARPVLEAAGFSVDGPCADQSGSGGG